MAAMRNVVPFKPRAGPAAAGVAEARLGLQHASVAGTGALAQQPVAFAVEVVEALQDVFELDFCSSSQQDVMMIFLLDVLIGNLEVAPKSSTIFKFCASD